MRSASHLRLFARTLPALSLALLYGCSDAPEPLAPAAGRTTPHAVLGAVITVTNTNDFGPGSLPQAIADATSGMVIQFDPGLAGQTIVLTNGNLKVAKALTIEGPATNGITISGGLSSRIFEVFGAADLVLRNLSIVNGRDDSGAGIGLFEGRVTLDHVLVANNETSTNGGGIEVADPRAELIVVNSTISGNVAGVGGGAIASEGLVTIRNSTIVSNIAQRGGGVFAFDGRVSLRNSIIANNVDNDDTNGLEPNCRFEAATNLTYSGSNLSNDDTCGASPIVQIANPKLGLLASNGGPTKTHALLDFSPAIDAGTLCTETTDQRYVARNQGVTCDIGAYEYNDYGTITITAGPNVALNARTGVATVTGTIKCSASTTLLLSVAMSQTQKTTGRFAQIVQAKGLVNVPTCATTASSWTIDLTAQTGKFEAGSASGSVASAIYPTNFLPVTVTAPLKVFQVK